MYLFSFLICLAMQKIVWVSFSAFSFAANTAYLAGFLADIFFLATLFFPDLKKSLFFVDCIIH